MITFKKRINCYKRRWRCLTDPYHLSTKKLTKNELKKIPLRSEIINFLIGRLKRDALYLEIGVRNPEANFNKIQAAKKYSVDPGFDFKLNPVDFKLTSDDFFDAIRNGKIFQEITFDLIFIDGLHLANQIERDINNSLKFLKDDGYIVMHDCNPPTEWHAAETYSYKLSPAMDKWNGTTWKAFFKARQRSDISSCCVDTDWGVGVISKKKIFGKSTKVKNPYFEFSVLNENRKDTLNLVTFEEFKRILHEKE